MVVFVQILRGTVVTGMGSFSFWIEKLHDHYLRKTGLRLFPGTLNVQLDHPWSLPPRRMRLEAAEYGGTVSVNLVPCSVFGRPAFILRTDANEEGRGHHPRSIVEVAADVKLRDHYQLQDGSPVEIKISGA
jgi:riboflavin kinase